MHQLLDATWWQKVGPTLAAVIVPVLTYLWLARRMARYQMQLNKDIEGYKIDLNKGLEDHKRDINKDIEHYKMGLSKGLEDHKKDINRELEVNKRYSEKQFHFYSELWSSLCDLRIAGNDLWEVASEHNLQNFSRQLKKTEDQIMKSSLLIEDWHYQRLEQLMREFNEFSVGKKRVRDFRNRQHRHNHQPDPIIEQDIQFAIDMNRATKERYTVLLEELEHYFKSQMRG
jgi:hypothetical protein